MPALRVLPEGKAQRALEKLGFAPVFYDRDTFTFRGAANAKVVRELQQLDFVRFLELHVPDQAMHDQAVAMIGQDRVRGQWPGTGVPVGIIDTGIDTSPLHLDFGGKGFLGWRSDGQRWRG
jgi:hypothetical protein